LSADHDVGAATLVKLIAHVVFPFARSGVPCSLEDIEHAHEVSLASMRRPHRDELVRELPAMPGPLQEVSHFAQERGRLRVRRVVLRRERRLDERAVHGQRVFRVLALASLRELAPEISRTPALLDIDLEALAMEPDVDAPARFSPRPQVL